MPGKRYSTEQIAAKLREAERLQGQARASRWVPSYAHRLNPDVRWHDAPATEGHGHRDLRDGSATVTPCDSGAR